MTLSKGRNHERLWLPQEQNIKGRSFLGKGGIIQAFTYQSIKNINQQKEIKQSAINLANTSSNQFWIWGSILQIGRMKTLPSHEGLRTKTLISLSKFGWKPKSRKEDENLPRWTKSSKDNTLKYSWQVKDENLWYCHCWVRDKNL